MTITAEGVISTRLYAWKQMIAATYQWQNWTDTAWTSAQALARIYTRLPAPDSGIDYTAAEILSYMPFCVVWMEPGNLKWEMEG